MQTRICSKCEVSQPAAAFDREAYRDDGLRTWCKSCYRFTQEEWEKNMIVPLVLVEPVAPPASALGPRACPRCRGYVTDSWGFAVCVNCGWELY